MKLRHEASGRGPRGFYPAAGKQILDTLLAGGAILAFSPFWLILALLVRIKMGAPVLFRQERPGLDGKLFTIMKFRSMNEARGADGELLPDDQRLTRFGRFLRGSSLDELPELLNVFRGDMALVGPRPLLMGYLDRYTSAQARRHEVRPGLTGWAQISGRNDILISRRIELDVWYVDHLNFWLDLKILLLTVPRVLRSRGVAVAEAQEVLDLGPSQKALTAKDGPSAAGGVDR